MNVAGIKQCTARRCQNVRHRFKSVRQWECFLCAHGSSNKSRCQFLLVSLASVALRFAWWNMALWLSLKLQSLHFMMVPRWRHYVKARECGNSCAISVWWHLPKPNFLLDFCRQLPRKWRFSQLQLRLLSNISPHDSEGTPGNCKKRRIANFGQINFGQSTMIHPSNGYIYGRSTRVAGDISPANHHGDNSLLWTLFYINWERIIKQNFICSSIYIWSHPKITIHRPLTALCSCY